MLTNKWISFLKGIILLILFQVLSGCALFNNDAYRTIGWGDGWAQAEAQMIRDYFGTRYLPHVNTLRSVELAIRSGTPALSAVTGKETTPGTKGIIVASRGSNGSFTYPVDMHLTTEQYEELLADDLFKDHGRSYLPFARSRIGGFEYPCYTLILPTGNLHLLLRAIQIDSSDTTSRITFGFILDKQWLLSQIPPVMDSLNRENVVMLPFQNPRQNVWRHFIEIRDKDGKDQIGKLIWSTGSNEEHEMIVNASIWPFYDEIKIAVRNVNLELSKN